jgi:hypothetical protein
VSDETQTDKPSLEDVILLAVRSELAKVQTSIPGRILTYDREKQRAQIQTSIRGRYENPETEELESYLPPPIPNVPVQFPSGGGFSITWPLKKNDDVRLAFCSRSIDEWLTSGSADNEPTDLRRFDLTDAVAIPGIRSFRNSLDGTEDNALVLQHESGIKIRVLDNGRITIENSSGELLEQISAGLGELATLCTDLGSSVTATAGGPQPLSNAALFIATGQRVNVLKSIVDALKG